MILKIQLYTVGFPQQQRKKLKNLAVLSTRSCVYSYFTRILLV